MLSASGGSSRRSSRSSEKRPKKTLSATKAALNDENVENQNSSGNLSDILKDTSFEKGNSRRETVDPNDMSNILSELESSSNKSMDSSVEAHNFTIGTISSGKDTSAFVDSMTRPVTVQEKSVLSTVSSGMDTASPMSTDSPITDNTPNRRLTANPADISAILRDLEEEEASRSYSLRRSESITSAPKSPKIGRQSQGSTPVRRSPRFGNPTDTNNSNGKNSLESHISEGTDEREASRLSISNVDLEGENNLSSYFIDNTRRESVNEDSDLRAIAENFNADEQSFNSGDSRRHTVDSTDLRAFMDNLNESGSDLEDSRRMTANISDLRKAMENADDSPSIINTSHVPISANQSTLSGDSSVCFTLENPTREFDFPKKEQTSNNLDVSCLSEDSVYATERVEKIADVSASDSVGLASSRDSIPSSNSDNFRRETVDPADISLMMKDLADAESAAAKARKSSRASPHASRRETADPGDISYLINELGSNTPASCDSSDYGRESIDTIALKAAIDKELAESSPFVENSAKSRGRRASSSSKGKSSTKSKPSPKKKNSRNSSNSSTNSSNLEDSSSNETADPVNVADLINEIQNSSAFSDGASTPLPADKDMLNQTCSTVGTAASIRTVDTMALIGEVQDLLEYEEALKNDDTTTNASMVSLGGLLAEARNEMEESSMLEANQSVEQEEVQDSVEVVNHSMLKPADEDFSTASAVLGSRIVPSSVLKSCLSSKKRARNANISFAQMDPPSAKRNVMFGSPNVAEFNRTSPTTNFTPLTKEDANSLYSMKGDSSKDSTEADEITNENSRILEEWDRLTNNSDFETSSSDENDYLGEVAADTVQVDDVDESINSDRSSRSGRRSRRRLSKLQPVVDYVESPAEAEGDQSSIHDNNFSGSFLGKSGYSDGATATVCLPGNLADLLAQNAVAAPDTYVKPSKQVNTSNRSEGDHTEEIEMDLKTLMNRIEPNLPTPGESSDGSHGSDLFANIGVRRDSSSESASHQGCGSLLGLGYSSESSMQSAAKKESSADYVQSENDENMNSKANIFDSGVFSEQDFTVGLEANLKSLADNILGKEASPFSFTKEKDEAEISMIARAQDGEALEENHVDCDISIATTEVDENEKLATTNNSPASKLHSTGMKLRLSTSVMGTQFYEVPPLSRISSSGAQDLIHRIRTLNAGARNNALSQCATPAAPSTSRMSIGMKRKSILNTSNKVRKMELSTVKKPRSNVSQTSEMSEINDDSKETTTIENEEEYEEEDTAVPMDIATSYFASPVVPTQVDGQQYRDLLKSRIVHFFETIQSVKISLCTYPSTVSEVATHVLKDNLKMALVHSDIAHIPYEEYLAAAWTSDQIPATAFADEILEQASHLTSLPDCLPYNILDDWASVWISRSAMTLLEQAEILGSMNNTHSSDKGFLRKVLNQRVENTTATPAHKLNSLLPLLASYQQRHISIDEAIANERQNLQEIEDTCEMISKLTYCRIITLKSSCIKLNMTLSPSVYLSLTFSLVTENKSLVVVNIKSALDYSVEKDVNNRNSQDIVTGYFNAFLANDLLAAENMSRQIKIAADIPVFLTKVRQIITCTINYY